MNPVICFDREEAISGWARDVILCSTANIVEVLASRPRILCDVEIAASATAWRRRRDAAALGVEALGPSPNVPARVPRLPAGEGMPAPAPASRKGVSRFLVGLGIWFCLVIIIGTTLTALKLDPDHGTIPAVLAGFVSWLSARRIVH